MQADDVEDDPGYFSDNNIFDVQQLDDGPGRSAGYDCDGCPRSFESYRGLKIHKAVHNRPMRSCNKKQGKKLA